MSSLPRRSGPDVGGRSSCGTTAPSSPQRGRPRPTSSQIVRSGLPASVLLWAQETAAFSQVSIRACLLARVRIRQRGGGLSVGNGSSDASPFLGGGELKRMSLSSMDNHSREEVAVHAPRLVRMEALEASSPQQAPPSSSLITKSPSFLEGVATDRYRTSANGQPATSSRKTRT